VARSYPQPTKPGETGQLRFPPETALWTSDLTGGIISSGGEFSNAFLTPFYQSATVKSYLTQPQNEAHLANLSPLGYFNPRGRGFPNVSSVALNYLVVSNGQLMAVSSTLVFTPLFRVHDRKDQEWNGSI